MCDDHPLRDQAIVNLVNGDPRRDSRFLSAISQLATQPSPPVASSPSPITEPSIPHTTKSTSLTAAADAITRPSRQCGHCRATLTSAKRCGRCRAVWYCSVQCQSGDWKKHRVRCSASIGEIDERLKRLRTSLSSEPHPNAAPAQLLFMDGLRLIFSYLNLYESTGVIQTCRTWAFILVNEKDRNETYRLFDQPNQLLSPLAVLQRLASSPLLSRHISGLRFQQKQGFVVDDLRLDGLVNLRKLDVVLQEQNYSDHKMNDWVKLFRGPLELPHTLESLRIHSTSDCDAIDFGGGLADDMKICRYLLAGISTISNLRHLSLYFHHFRWHLDLLPLLKCKLLESLSIRGGRLVSMHDLSPIAHMTQLRALDLEPFPCRFSWIHSTSAISLQKFNLWPLNINNEQLRLLSQLPALTSIQPKSLTLKAVRRLDDFVYLKELLLDIQHVPKPIRGELWLNDILRCHRLEQLQLCCCQMTLNELATLVRNLIKLTKLIFFQAFLRTESTSQAGSSPSSPISTTVAAAPTIRPLLASDLIPLQTTYPRVQFTFVLRKSPFGRVKKPHTSPKKKKPKEPYQPPPIVENEFGLDEDEQAELDWNLGGLVL